MQIYEINFSLLTLFSLLIYRNAIYKKPRPRKRIKMRILLLLLLMLMLMLRACCYKCVKTQTTVRE